MGGKGIGSTKYVPEKMELFNNDSNIVSIGLGPSFIGILRETKDEFKENEFVLKSGEEMTVQNTMNDIVGNRTLHSVYIQNKALFGDNDWIEIESNAKYLSFCYFGHKFVENLVMNKDKNMIELIGVSEIDTIYHSDIIGAEFFLSFDNSNKMVIKTESDKKELMDKTMR